MSRRRTKKQQTARKSSEGVVSRTLATLLCVPQSDTVDSVAGAFVDHYGDQELSHLIGHGLQLYPWVLDVASDIMSNDTSDVLEHLLIMPDSLWILKDTMRSGKDALWLAVADPGVPITCALNKVPYRGLCKNVLISGGLHKVIAIQLNTCLKK